MASEPMTTPEPSPLLTEAELAWLVTAIDRHLDEAAFNQLGWRLIAQARAARPSPWQPIETAPKDGTEFLAVEAGIDEPIRQVHWSKGSAVAAGGYWVERRYNQIVRPMWWMPQPSPPAPTPR